MTALPRWLRLIPPYRPWHALVWVPVMAGAATWAALSGGDHYLRAGVVVLDVGLAWLIGWSAGLMSGRREAYRDGEVVGWHRGYADAHRHRNVTPTEGDAS